MEELIIRVKIDGFQGGAQEGGSGGQGAGGAAGLGIAAGIAAGSNRFSQVALKGESVINKFLQQGAPKVSFKLGNAEDVVRTSQRAFTARYKIPGQFLGRDGSPLESANTMAPSVDIFRGSHVDEYLRSKFTPKVLSAMGSAAMWKGISAASSIAQHRSGDSYYNQQLQNGIRLAGYAATLAMSGPFAPVIAAGIAVNEGVNAAVGAINFNYDRNMEGRQITNIKLLAGDISYGRNRGGI